MTFQIPSTSGVRTAAQYQLYPKHVKAPQETPMDRAVRIAGSLTNEIKRMLKEPNREAGIHGKALEQLKKIFETTTEKLEKGMRTEHKPRPHPQQKQKSEPPQEYTPDLQEITQQE